MSPDGMWKIMQNSFGSNFTPVRPNCQSLSLMIFYSQYVQIMTHRSLRLRRSSSFRKPVFVSFIQQLQLRTLLLSPSFLHHIQEPLPKEKKGTAKHSINHPKKMPCWMNSGKLCQKNMQLEILSYSDVRPLTIMPKKRLTPPPHINSHTMLFPDPCLRRWMVGRPHSRRSPKSRTMSRMWSP